jgi:IS5 family transposase
VDSDSTRGIMFAKDYEEEVGGIKARAFNTSVHIKRPRETAISGGMDQGVVTSMTTINIASRCAETLSVILDSVEIADLIEQLEILRWTGRPGYSTRTLIGVVLAKSLYAIPTWTRTLSLVREHRALRTAIGCEDDDEVPSIDAIYRFKKKLGSCKGQLQECIDSVLQSLHEKKPEMGKDIAIDGSSLPAYANGQRFVSKGGRERSDDEFSDPDASWGHRSAVSTRKGGGFYGYKLHMAVDTATDLPLAWEIHTAKDAEAIYAISLLDEVTERGFNVHTAALDKGYDAERIYTECEERDVRPIIPLRKTPLVKRGEHKPPVCEHGEWRFAGADKKRSATKWRCPTGECQPASVWVQADRLHSLVPRETDRWKKLYCGRASVEREFGRLKNEWGLTPLRVRRIERVKLHADLTILAKLACVLSTIRTSGRAACSN